MPASLKSPGIRCWMGNTRKRGFLLWVGIAAGQTLCGVLWIFFSSITATNGEAEVIGGVCAMTYLNSVVPLFCMAFYQSKYNSCSWGSEGPSFPALILGKQLQNLAWPGKKSWILCSFEQSASARVRLTSWGKHFVNADGIGGLPLVVGGLACLPGVPGCFSKGSLDLDIPPVKTIGNKVLVLERVLSPFIW